MLLAIDVGNTTTLLGAFDGDRLTQHWRISTEASRTADELLLVLQGLFGFAGLDVRADVDGVVVASVVPAVSEALRAVVDDHLAVPGVVVEPGVRTGLPLRYENPREIGADRIANAVAAFSVYGGPAIVVDFGTATSFDAVNGHGEFVGGAIAPGVVTSTEALVRRTARLPTVEAVTPPHAIGRSTIAALQSGIVFGFAGQVDSIVSRMADELGPDVTVVATGGLPAAVLDACTCIDHHDPWLTLEGLRLIWDRNRQTG